MILNKTSPSEVSPAYSFIPMTFLCIAKLWVCSNTSSSAATACRCDYHAQITTEGTRAELALIPGGSARVSTGINSCRSAGGRGVRDAVSHLSFSSSSSVKQKSNRVYLKPFRVAADAQRCCRAVALVSLLASTLSFLSWPPNDLRAHCFHRNQFV